MEEDRLIFLISLPRSGSTLLQKIISSNKSIESVSEPWLLLPLMHLTKNEGTKAIYSSKKSSEFINELIEELSEGRKTFDKFSKEFVLKVYGNILKNKDNYFLDKTPRYYRIVDDLYRVFPNARFVFLIRNPLQIISSIITSSNMCNNNLSKLHEYDEDLFVGFNLMSESIEKYKSRSFVVNYDQLIKNPSVLLRNICAYFNLPFEDSMISDFQKTEFKGSAGDNTGIKSYDSINNGSLFSWKRKINTFTKKKIALKVIGNIPEAYFLSLETTKDNEINSLKNLKISIQVPKELKDILNYTISVVKVKLKRKVLYY